MRELLIETPEGVDLRHELAGPGSRSAAAVVDMAVFGLIALGVFLALALASSVDPTGLSNVLMALLAGGMLLVLVVYVFLQAVWMEGRSFGKHLLGLRVTSADGYPASAGQLLLRSLFFPLELTLIGLVFMLSTSRWQRLGDLVAGTVVQREPRAGAEVEPFPNEAWSRLPQRTLALVPALAARLDAGDFEFLRRLLARRDLAPAQRRALYVSAANHYAAELGLGSFEDARVFLKELYLFLREGREQRS